MQSTRAAKGAADFFAGNGFSGMVDDNQSSLSGIAQVQQCLAESRHSAGVVLILIVSGVERIEHDDFGSRSPGGEYEMMETLGCTEEMSRGLYPPADDDPLRDRDYAASSASG
jgi:hypothetical protein